MIPLWQEVENYKEYQHKLRAYLGRRKANRVLRQALYLVSLGTNDFLENYYTLPHRRSQFTVEQYQNFIVGLSENFLRKIYSLGARKISLTGLPPMGCLPLERTTNIFGQHECIEDYNKVALQFNGKLKGMVAKLNEVLPGLKLVITESTYDDIYQIIKNPASYGESFLILSTTIIVNWYIPVCFACPSFCSQIQMGTKNFLKGSSKLSSSIIHK